MDIYLIHLLSAKEKDIVTHLTSIQLQAARLISSVILFYSRCGVKHARLNEPEGLATHLRIKIVVNLIRRLFIYSVTVLVD